VEKQRGKWMNRGKGSGKKMKKMRGGGRKKKRGFRGFIGRGWEEKKLRKEG